MALIGLLSRIWSRVGWASTDDLNAIAKIIMQTQAQLAEDLRAVLAKQQKTHEEILATKNSIVTLKGVIVDLEAVIAKGEGATEELANAVAAVKLQAQIVDDDLPDVTPIVVVPAQEASAA